MKIRDNLNYCPFLFSGSSFPNREKEKKSVPDARESDSKIFLSYDFLFKIVSISGSQVLLRQKDLDLRFL